MKRKSKAYISIYALYMIFVLMIVIVFVLVQVKNIRTVNAYKYDYIQAKAIAYSKVRIINQRKLFDEELKKNSKSDTFYIQITDIPEFNHPTKIDYYEEKDGATKIFSFTSKYPDNNGSRVTTRMVYNRKNPFEKRIISEEKIDELLPEIIEGKKSIEIKDCLIFSLNDETYFVDKKIADENNINIDISKATIAEVEAKQDGYDVIFTTSNYRNKLRTPHMSVFGLVSGINKDKNIEDIKSMLEELSK